jgi:hypothetical protein
MLTRARALVLALVLISALAIAACGSSGGGSAKLSADDPAHLAPADAPVYIQATLRPQGSQKADVEKLASTVSGLQDPTAKLVSLLDKAFNEEKYLGGKKLSFENDIDPWLGAHAGLFVMGLSGNPPAAGIVQTTDPKAAQQFIDDAKQPGDRDGSYKGIDYSIDGKDGTAAGIVDDFLVVGKETAFKAAVDVSKGGDALADQSQFTDAIGNAASDSIADAYIDLGAATREAKAQNPQGASGISGAFGDTEGKSVIASLVPTADSLEVEAGTDAQQSVATADLGNLIGGFPASSFAAAGVPDLGGIIDRTVNQLDQAGVPGVSRAAIDQQLAQASLSLDDITSALGDVGIFAGGTNLGNVGGAAVITAKDKGALAKLSSKLTAITALAQASGQQGIGPAPVGQGVSISDPAQLGPQPLIITTANDRIVIGYGEKATREAISGGGGSPLADDPTYKRATDALGGGGVSEYVSLPGVFKLAEGLGALRDPDYKKARPYLQRLSYVIAGPGKVGDLDGVKFIAGVQP